TNRPMAGPSAWTRLTRWRSVKIRLKLIACATSRATAISSAIWPIRLRGIRPRLRKLGSSIAPAPASEFPHLGGEHVAAAPHRLDQPGIRRILLDLLPEAADVVVDAALEGGKLAALGEVEQLVAAQHAA